MSVTFFLVGRFPVASLKAIVIVDNRWEYAFWGDRVDFASEFEDFLYTTSSDRFAKSMCICEICIVFESVTAIRLLPPYLEAHKYISAWWVC